MRFVAMGLLIIGVLTMIGSGMNENPAGAQYALLFGGFLFLSGTVLAASVGVQDAIKKQHR